MKTKKRIDYIDVAKGITILLVIIGHSIDFGWKRELIFSFHMPLFVICSGFFYKNRSYKEELSKNFNFLFKPYIFWLFIFVMLLFVIDYEITFANFLINFKFFLKSVILSICAPSPGKLNINTGIIGGVGSLWFIPMLIVVRLLFLTIDKITRSDEFKIFLCTVLISLLGYILGIKSYYLPFMIDVAMYCMIFYYFGYLLRKYNIIEKIRFSDFILIILIFIFGFRFSWNELVNRYYPAFSIINAFGGSVIVIKLSFYLSKKINIGTLKWIGANTMNILGVHQCDSLLLFLIFQTSFSSLTGNLTLNKIYFSLIRICFCVMLSFLIYFVKKMINKSNKKLKIK